MYIYIYIYIGFLPRDTAKHHQEHVLPVLKKALEDSKLSIDEIDVVCYTKGKKKASKSDFIYLLIY